MKRLVLLMFIVIGFYSCTANEEASTPSTPLNPNWTGTVVDMAFVHSLQRVITQHKGRNADSVYQDTNPNNTVFSEYSSTIKIGKTRDSLSNGDILTISPQNGFIVFDLGKNFSGTISNIKTANLKVKLYKKTYYTDDLKFVVSILDTTILAQTVKERIATVQSSAGQSSGYLTELTMDIKGSFTSNKKIVIGIRADNAGQEFASVQYCKIEFDADIITPQVLR